MTLIKSISGIRGTIGGSVGDNLTPVDIVNFASAFGAWIKEKTNKTTPKIVVGRDARLSGAMVQELVMQTLVGLGVEVLDLGLSTTPTVELAVPWEHADGGIILTASHNPKQWNALKLLNAKGEFISASDGKMLLEKIEKQDFNFAKIDDLGSISVLENYFEKHIDHILGLEMVDVTAIKNANFKAVVDGVNSTGGVAVPMLLEALGVQVTKIHCEPTGHFAHNPEPLKEHLWELSERVVTEKADFGITVDPDVDRLAFVCEDGEMFGEEYTLVACADYILSKKSGHVTSNLSSSRALRDVAQLHGGCYDAAKVGEVNVVELMKAKSSVIGGEGNGGIIYPDSHYGRDALVGIALFLTHLANQKVSISVLRKTYPAYFMYKGKINLTPDIDIDGLLLAIKEKYTSEKVTAIDGVKVDLEEAWFHLRKSNTEPIIRVYTEAKSLELAQDLAKIIQKQIAEILEVLKK